MLLPLKDLSTDMYKILCLSIIAISLGLLSLIPYWVNGTETQQIDIDKKIGMSIVLYPIYLFPVYEVFKEAFNKNPDYGNLGWSIFFLLIFELVLSGLILGGEVYTPLEIVYPFFNLLLFPLSYLKYLLPDLTFTEWLLLGIFLALVFICLRLFKLDKTKYRD